MCYYGNSELRGPRICGRGKLVLCENRRCIILRCVCFFLKILFNV